VLWLQYQIALAGVLDTQVLHGMVSLGQVVSIGSDASMRMPQLQQELKRVGLGKLYAKYGFPHPTKDEVAAGFSAAGGRWVVCAGEWGGWV